MLPLLDARQLLDLAKYHSIVGQPGVDHCDVPLALQCLVVFNALRGETSEPLTMEQVMPHLAEPAIDVDEAYEKFQTFKQGLNQ